MSAQATCTRWNLYPWESFPSHHSNFTMEIAPSKRPTVMPRTLWRHAQSQPEWRKEQHSNTAGLPAQSRAIRSIVYALTTSWPGTMDCHCAQPRTSARSRAPALDGQSWPRIRHWRSTPISPGASGSRWREPMTAYPRRWGTPALAWLASSW